jgi:hypothetical protein
MWEYLKKLFLKKETIVVKEWDFDSLKEQAFLNAFKDRRIVTIMDDGKTLCRRAVLVNRFAYYELAKPVEEYSDNTLKNYFGVSNIE